MSGVPSLWWKMITQQRLKELLHYDPETGRFTRLVSNRTDRIGSEPGALNNKGYRQIRLDGTLYCAHRLAWLYVHGKFPPAQLDHVNGNRSDDRIINLREATNKQNQENVPLQVNNTSGFRGVSYDTHLGKYRAYVCHNREMYWFGCFDSAEEAGMVAKGARDLLFTHHTERSFHRDK